MDQNHQANQVKLPTNMHTIEKQLKIFNFSPYIQSEHLFILEYEMERKRKKIYPIKVQETSTSAENKIKNEEIQRMILQAISTARKYGIEVEWGTRNPALGDCAFESAILNNNDRQCFQEKYTMSADYYRRIWTGDMCNRTIRSPWNIYTDNEWREGWKKMAVPGQYELAIFGDLIVPAIACGLKKYIIIFNTVNDSYNIIDPIAFDVKPDSPIPLVLAYNLHHYESLHPCTSSDIMRSITLVKSDTEHHFPFDNEYLLSIISSIQEYSVEENVHGDKGNSFLSSKLKCKKTNLNKDTDSVGEILPERKNMNEQESMGIQLFYKLRGQNEEKVFEENMGKIQCPFCQKEVKNICLHFDKETKCKGKIDVNHFNQSFESFNIAKKREREAQETKL